MSADEFVFDRVDGLNPHQVIFFFVFSFSSDRDFIIRSTQKKVQGIFFGRKVEREIYHLGFSSFKLFWSDM